MARIDVTLDNEQYLNVMKNIPIGMKKSTWARMLLLQKAQEVNKKGEFDLVGRNGLYGICTRDLAFA